MVYLKSILGTKKEKQVLRRLTIDVNYLCHPNIQNQRRRHTYSYQYFFCFVNVTNREGYIMLATNSQEVYAIFYEVKVGNNLL